MSETPVAPPRANTNRLIAGLVAVLLLVTISYLLARPARPDETAQPTATALSGDTASPAAEMTTTETPATQAVMASPTGTPMPTDTPAPVESDTPAAPQPTATPGQLAYTIQSGDTLGSIAKQYGVTAADIAQASGISERSTLHIGQVVIVPVPQPAGDAPAPAGSPAPVEATPQPPAAEGQVITYTVEKGDVLSAIAKKFDVSINTIISANQLADPERLSVGQTLLVPLGTPTPVPTATPLPTPTPTAGPPFPAPALLSPAGDEKISGEVQSVLLNWSAVGLLTEDEWYLVRLWKGAPPRGDLVQFEWTKSNSLRVMPDRTQGGTPGPQTFYWTVLVVHRGTEEVRQPLGWNWEPLCPDGERRLFIWLP